MRITVELGERSYPILITGDGFAGLGEAVMSALPLTDRAIVVSNDTVWPLFGDAVSRSLTVAGVSVSPIVVPDGEREKSLEGWGSLIRQMLELGIDRQTPVIAVGGGVVGDLAGFAAASVLRGVPFVQAPTSLLSMVDSSVGGKTGVNTSHGKNMVGAFHQPSLVYASIDALQHLPEREFLSGLGEVVKHGVLADPVLFGRCRSEASSILRREPELIEDLVVRSIQVKRAVVSEDERELGRRAVLNLGHTVGHAVETVLLGTPNALPHGICVGIGLAAEVAWSAGRGDCSPDTVREVQDVLEGLSLPTQPPPVDCAAVLDAVMFDKKARRGKLRTPVVEKIGQVRLVDVDLARLSDLFHSILGFS
jgi:3-dehydroquinate synthase